MDELYAYCPCGRVVVAVSGGADSLCLTLMVHDWAKSKNVPLTALTVDHGLRPESNAEALQVHDWLDRYQIEHFILKWCGKKPTSCVEEKAREARYRLLLDWCIQNKANCLLVAHHQEDQMETFFLRLARSSGVDGLSAMRPVSIRDGILILRPFLGFKRSALQNMLREHYHQQWIEDPSNQNTHYERVRLRQAFPFFEKLGIFSSAVGLSVERLGRVRDCLEMLTASFIKEKVNFSPAGFAFIDKESFSALPSEMALRVLAFVLNAIGNHPVLRMEKLEKLYAGMPCFSTLGGCEIVPFKKGFFICRELAKMDLPRLILAGEKVVWDRFIVSVQQDAVVGPLKEALKTLYLPAKVRRTIPAFYQKNKLVSVPYLDYYTKKDDIKGVILFRK